MPKKPIFAVSEESDAGGASHCWVKKTPDGYSMYGNELGKMSGPCATVKDAVELPGFQFGMDFVTIEATITPEELFSILASECFLLANVASLSINGIAVEDITPEGVVRAYMAVYQG